MKLTDTQIQILLAAAAQEDRLAKRPAIPPAPRAAIEAKLHTAGLIEQVSLDVAEQAEMSWRHVDGAAIGYRVTAAGLAAVGRAEGAAQLQTASGLQEASQAPQEAVTARGVPNTLRGAAVALLTAWNASQDRAGLEDAVTALRAALVGRLARVPRVPAAPRKPREGTKQQQVLGLLRRAEGTTIAQIMEATAWQQHTVRGFLAGLKKRQGISVEVLDRVRQVGPNKHGSKGSYSVYRIANAG
jgi:hypothetical protein